MACYWAVGGCGGDVVDDGKITHRESQPRKCQPSVGRNQTTIADRPAGSQRQSQRRGHENPQGAAFKHQSKVQGDWGETVLTELLTSQGLTQGVQFDTQASIRNAKGETIKSEDGNIMRPDLILHLDQKREVIIDFKVSLTAFFDFVNAENESERQQLRGGRACTTKKVVVLVFCRKNCVFLRQNCMCNE